MNEPISKLGFEFENYLRFEKPLTSAKFRFGVRVEKLNLAHIN